MAFSSGGGGGLLGNMRSSLNDLGVEETTTGDQITVDQHVSNIDSTVQSIFERLGNILDSIPGNYNSSPNMVYGDRGPF